MNNRIKLIVFFVICAVVIFILGIVWIRQGGGKIEASPSEISVVEKNEISLILDDYLEKVSPESTSIYHLKITNRSSQNLENLRIFGYVGLPSGDGPIDQIFPEWLIFKKTYSEKYYFDYVIDLVKDSSASAKIHVKIKKFTEDQDKVYAIAHIQALTANDPWWNIFSLGGGYKGPIIASVEDINILE